MKTARQWIESYERGDSPNEREIREIQLDAMRAGLEVAIERMKDFWGHEIVRVIARDLCVKNGLDYPYVPFDPTRNPPTPSEVPPPKTLENWGNATRPEPGYPPPVLDPGPLFPSQSPAHSNPPPKDCFADPPTPAVELDPRFLNPVQEVLNATVRQLREEMATHLAAVRAEHSSKISPFLAHSLGQAKAEVQEWLEQIRRELWEVLAQAKGMKVPHPIEAPPGDYEGQQVNAVLKWTDGQWLLLQSQPR